jgi:hypothetical protein
MHMPVHKHVNYFLTMQMVQHASACYFLND